MYEELSIDRLKMELSMFKSINMFLKILKINSLIYICFSLRYTSAIASAIFDVFK